MSNQLESRYQIAQALQELGIDTRPWEKFTFGDLCRTVEKEMVELTRNDGHLDLIVHSAVALVQFRLGPIRLQVRELFQYFYATRSFLQRPAFDGIAETIHRGEENTRAVHRLLKEELGFRDPDGYRLHDLGIEVRGPMRSEKWPSSLLEVTFRRHKFLCETRPTLLRPLYLERRPNKVIVFAPVPVPIS